MSHESGYEACESTKHDVYADLSPEPEWNNSSRKISKPAQLNIDRSSTTLYTVRAGRSGLVTNLHSFVVGRADLLHDSGNRDWRIEHNHAGASVDSLGAAV